MKAATFLGTACLLLQLGLSSVISSTPAKANEYYPMNRGTQQELRALKKRHGWKAFAYSQDYIAKRNGAHGWYQSTGSSWNYTSRAAAERLAIQTCLKDAAFMSREKGVKCKVVYVSM